HLKRDAARKYFAEIARILRPGGRMYLTAFASSAHCRVWNEEDDHARYSYEIGITNAYLHEGRLHDELARCGLTVVFERPGHWRVDSSPPKLVGAFQDLFIAERSNA